MSGRRHKKKRLAERRRYVQRFMRTYIADLRQILQRAWPAYERSHPDTRGPCHTCAFNPSTDTWPGFEKTAFSLMDAIRKGQPFHCHEGLPTKPNGEWYYDPAVPPPPRCPRLGGDRRAPRDRRGRVRGRQEDWARADVARENQKGADTPRSD